MPSAVRIQEEDFDVAAEWAACRERGGGDAGAIVAFGGLVRDRHGDEDVRGLYLEHYPGMTEASIAAVVAQAERRWALCDALVIHRVGELAPLDQIVLVLAAAPHRADAFAACEFVMDYLKTDAVIWKKERRAQGDAWLRATDDDQRRRSAWRARNSGNAGSDGGAASPADAVGEDPIRSA